MSSSSSTSSNLQSRFCFCGIRARESTAHTEKNRGRRFYGCRMYRSPKKCNFFEWRDEEYTERSVVVINNLVQAKAQLEGEIWKLQTISSTQQVEIDKFVGEVATYKATVDRLELELQAVRSQNLKVHDRNGITVFVVCMVVVMCLNVVVLKFVM